MSLGDVYIISPCGPFDQSCAEKGEQWLRERGLSIKQSAVRRPQFINYNGTDEQRITDFEPILKDSGTPIMWLNRGGSGLLRLLPQISGKFSKSRLVFIGFSDGTALLSHLWTHYGLAGIHGPNVVSVPSISLQSEQALLKLLAFRAKDIDYPELEILHAVQGNQVIEGTLIVANLCVLSSLVGTTSLPLSQPTVLVLEDIEEAPYKIDRMLTQLYASGSLKQVRAIVMGSFLNCGDDEALQKIFMDFAQRLNISLFAGMKVGHEDDNWALPFGVQSRIEIENGNASLHILQELNQVNRV